MSTITLYNYELDDSCYRVRLLLSMLSLKHQTFAVDMVPGNEHKGEAMLGLNPQGALPVLTDGDLTLYGTEAILAYLARAYDPAATWLPAEPGVFGQVMQWLTFSAAALAGTSEVRKLSLFGLPGDEDGLRADARRAFRIMDDHITVRQLQGSEWFVGSAATLADLTLFPIFALSRDFGIDHDEFPGLRRWIRRFRAIPGFKTMPGIPDYH
ncbi:MAG: glutathione S-transferase family protein [Allorhizobium sp.]